MREKNCLNQICYFPSRSGNRILPESLIFFEAAMQDILQNLEELSLCLPPVPKPLAGYVPVVRFQDTVFVSGQLPVQAGEVIQGRVPDTCSEEDARRAAGVCFLNALSAALSVISQKETLRLIQIQGFVHSAPDFYAIPSIVDGASELAQKILGERGLHARTAVGVSSLPKGAPVEIACVFGAVPAFPPRHIGRYKWFSGNFDKN